MTSGYGIAIIKMMLKQAHFSFTIFVCLQTRKKLKTKDGIHVIESLEGINLIDGKDEKDAIEKEQKIAFHL